MPANRAIASGCPQRAASVVGLSRCYPASLGSARSQRRWTAKETVIAASKPVKSCLGVSICTCFKPVRPEVALFAASIAVILYARSGGVAVPKRRFSPGKAERSVSMSCREICSLAPASRCCGELLTN